MVEVIIVFYHLQLHRTMKLKDQDDDKNGTFQMSIFDDVLYYYTPLLTNVSS